MTRRPPRPTLFPYPPLSRSAVADLFNARYNPAGTQSADAYTFPYGDGRFDFALATSVFTHLLEAQDRKSTRLNSSHPSISYAVFCLKKKKKESHDTQTAWHD